MTALLERPVVTEYFEPKIGETWWQPIADILANWYSGDGGRPGHWDGVLANARTDYHYDDVVNSLQKRGFVVPLTCRWKDYQYPYFMDGHHRLAAAIDLGRTHVKMKLHEYYFFYKNSQDWSEGLPITRKSFTYDW